MKFSHSLSSFTRTGTSEKASGGLVMSQPLSTEFPLVLSRIMLPADANPGGNVHGGTVLKMIAESGYIQCMKHCHSANKEGESNASVAVIARVEHTDFLQPVFIGELAEVYAKVTFTSKHSMEVKAEVWAENLLTGAKRLTNKASLWYVAVDGEEKKHNGVRKLNTTTVPQLALSEEEQKLGEQRYLTQKASRMSKTSKLDPAHLGPGAGLEVPVVHSPLHSQTTLSQLVLPMDCHVGGILQGGAVMKLMDTCAGVVAARHCKTNVVTASLDAIDFLSPIVKGELVTVKGCLVYTSSKSMEILVTVEAENIQPDSYRITNKAFFTFVSLDRGTGKCVQVPALQPQTERDLQLYEEGKKRYEENKKKRTQKQQEQQQESSGK